MEEEIKLNKLMKGQIVFAKPAGNAYLKEPWIILIGAVQEIYLDNKLSCYHIDRIASYGINNDRFCFDEGSVGGWGMSTYFTFHKPTREQVKLLMDKIKKTGHKYIPVLNKVIKI